MMSSDRAKELKNSLLWADVVEELDKKIYHITQTLITCKPEELLDKQKEIKALESVKRLPDDVIDREE